MHAIGDNMIQLTKIIAHIHNVQGRIPDLPENPAGADYISARKPGRGKPLPYIVVFIRNAVGADSRPARKPGRGKSLPYF